MKHLLIEHGELALDEQCADFCGFVCEKLGLSHCPPITFVEHTGNASFGSYSPSEGTIVVATHGRHEADVLRTLAHELVHDHQITVGTEMTLEEMEYEANAVAGMLMRDWNKAHPELYGVAHAENADGDEGESMGATFADPTRPSGPVGLAELSNKTLARYKRVANYELRNLGRSAGWIKYHHREYFRGLDLKKKREAGAKTAEDKLRKRYNVQEDAPVNAAGSGEIAGIGVGPQGEPGIKKSNMIKRKPKSDLAKIFTGFPKPPKLFKEYKAQITRRLGDEAFFGKQTLLVKPKKNLASLGLPNKSLKQILRGK